MNFINHFFEVSAKIHKKIDQDQLAKMVDLLVEVREKRGRLFILGNGGSAGHAGHATNDFRKLCGIETYAPTDNVSELTARINDEGWENCFSDWMLASNIRAEDAILIFSVGGGSKEKNISPNIVRAIDCARNHGAKVLGIVGKDGGYTKEQAHACVLVAVEDASLITPMTEGYAALLWHMLVSHPKLQVKKGKWESVAKP